MRARSLDVFYSSLIDKSTTRNHLLQIHAHLAALGLRENGFLITKFLNACANVGETRYARQVFDEFPDPYVFLWNAVIRGYAKHNLFDVAIRFYSRMQMARVSPDCFTFPHVLKACGEMLSLRVGKFVHGQIFRRGFHDDVFVQNGLVAMYCKCGEVELARVVFEGLTDRTIVSWTSVISGCSQNGQSMEALRLFSQMRLCGNVRPDWIALVSVLKAYADLEDLNQGKSVHVCVIKMGLEVEQDLVVTLIAMYARSGQVGTARSMFDRVECPNLLLWNAMISGHAKHGSPEKGLELFKIMIGRNISMDSITLRSAILAQVHAGSLKEAKWMDDFIREGEYRDDVFVSSALIDMYAKCGSVDSARMVFDRTIRKDVVTYFESIARLSGWK
uniref:Pentatricopeptide repeat-containing protein n=1 Tax=Kalanchoe fedtschenkoi TaxID=63787 RepID=A0A7N0U6J3_KALFE